MRLHDYLFLGNFIVHFSYEAGSKYMKFVITFLDQ